MTSRADELIWAIAHEMEKTAKPAAELEREDLTPEARREGNLRDADVESVLTRDDVRALVRDQQLRATPALEATRRWFNARSTGMRANPMLVLLGGTGRGKTLAAAWVLARLGGRYITSEKLRRTVLSARRDEFDKTIGTRVLVVDDVGVELDPASAEIALFEMVNWRLGMARGWTVLTSNLSWRDFGERFGERTARRLEHGAAIITLEGQDLRRRRGSP